jgi:hypothetical protein
MNDKEFNRVLAGSALVGLFAVHWLPKRLLPMASPGLAALFVVGGLLLVHGNPLKILWRDLQKSFGARPKSLPASPKASAPIAENNAPQTA